MSERFSERSDVSTKGQYEDFCNSHVVFDPEAIIHNQKLIASMAGRGIGEEFVCPHKVIENLEAEQYDPQAVKDGLVTREEYDDKAAQLHELMRKLSPGIQNMMPGPYPPIFKEIKDIGIISLDIEQDGSMTTTVLGHYKGYEDLDYIRGVRNGEGWSGPETKFALKAAIWPRATYGDGDDLWYIHQEFLDGYDQSIVFATANRLEHASRVISLPAAKAA